MTQLRGLTTRGRCLLAFGLSLALLAVAFGLPDLLRVGVFLLALPLVAVAVVARTRYRLSCRRVLDPPRVPAGRVSSVQLRLHNVSRLPSGVLLMEDRLPLSLGGRPRFSLDRVAPGGTRDVSYTVRAEARGRYVVGPLAVQLTDPFGLVELRRSFTQTEELIVTPTVSALPPVRLGGDWVGGGEDARTHAHASGGSDDATTRQYRQGDDLRKVHWRSTARAGELMVRREEQPVHSRATLLLDGRRSAHRGDGPGSSYEWAVCAAASVGSALIRSGFVVHLAAEDGLGRTPADAGTSEPVLLDALAVIEQSRADALQSAAAALRVRSDGVLVAVLGQLTAQDAQALARLRSGFGTAIAVLLDTPTWAGGPGPAARSWGAAPARDDEPDPSSPAALLQGAGWRVLPIRHGTTLASVWALAGIPAGRIGAGR